MNQSSLLILSGLLAFLPLSAQKLDSLAEHASIQKICMAETQAWLDKNPDAYAATHLQSEQDLLIWNNPDGTYSSFSGWKAVDKAIREDAKSNPKSSDKLTFENAQFTIRGDMAFVMYDQILTAADGKSQKSREHRVLLFDAKSSRWKIQSVMAFYNHTK